jgi:hypothetical protein
VNNIPTTGGMLYARLCSLVNSTWVSQDYTFIEAGTPLKAAITSPAPGSRLGTSRPVTFHWDQGKGVTETWLAVGTTHAGSANLYDAGTLTGMQATVSGIPTNGSTLYVTLYSLIDGVWQSIAYTYVAGP